jgi:hypothetical protein
LSVLQIDMSIWEKWNKDLQKQFKPLQNKWNEIQQNSQEIHRNFGELWGLMINPQKQQNEEQVYEPPASNTGPRKQLQGQYGLFIEQMHADSKKEKKNYQIKLLE